MKGLIEGLAGFVNDFSPKASTDMPINLEAIAKAGREAVFDRNRRKADGRFHPSKLASPCLKHDVIERILLEILSGTDIDDPKLPNVIDTLGDDAVYAIRGEKFELKGQRAMDVGTAFHEMEQQTYFAPSGKLLGHWSCTNCHRVLDKALKPIPTKPCTNVVEVRGQKGNLVRRLLCPEHGSWRYEEVHIVHEELQISARIDLIFELQDGGLMVVDIKSMDPDLWARLEQPSPKDVVQLQIYIWLMNARYGILRYVNKGKQKTIPKEFTLTPDPKIETWVREYISTVRELVEARRWEDLGGVCNKKTQVRAKRCPFSFLCF